jgi:hypothetical protein
MSHWRRLALFGTLAAGALAAPTSARPAERCASSRSPIMILGTYHMANPGRDAVNMEADDVLSARRQGEIAELTEKLARFRPTKVMLEAPYSSPLQQQRYQQYLAGSYQLSRNEIDQIGFRLAKRMGLKAVTPIDYPMMMSGLTYDEVESKPPPKPPAVSALATATPAKPPEPRKLSEDELRLRRSTVANFLFHMNEPARAERDHLAYMDLFQPDPESSALYQRADLLTNWYKRNFRMFANVVRKTERPGDRVLLLVGAGHLKILRDLASGMPGFCLVEPQDYLK